MKGILSYAGLSTPSSQNTAQEEIQGICPTAACLCTPDPPPHLFHVIQGGKYWVDFQEFNLPSLFKVACCQVQLQTVMIWILMEGRSPILSSCLQPPGKKQRSSWGGGAPAHYSGAPPHSPERLFRHHRWPQRGVIKEAIGNVLSIYFFKLT